MGKTIALSFIDATISFVTRFGADTPMKISVFFIASCNVPSLFSLFVISDNSFLYLSKFSLFILMIPFLSHIKISLIPRFIRSLAIELPAAPEPLITTVESSNFFPANFRELIMAAAQTTAVPC